MIVGTGAFAVAGADTVAAAVTVAVAVAAADTVAVAVSVGVGAGVGAGGVETAVVASTRVGSFFLNAKTKVRPPTRSTANAMPAIAIVRTPVARCDASVVWAANVEIPGSGGGGVGARSSTLGG